MVKRIRINPQMEIDPSTKDRIDVEALFKNLVNKGAFIHNSWQFYSDKEVVVSAFSPITDETIECVLFTDPIAKVFYKEITKQFPNAKSIFLTQLINPDTNLQSMIFFQECIEVGRYRLIAAPYSRFLLLIQEYPSFELEDAIEVTILDLSRVQYDSKV